MPPPATAFPLEASELTRRLLAWYDPHARDVPWRGTDDPYHVLLAEFLLQQTRMTTARPKLKRFLERWPTVEDLAAAGEEAVLAEWSGLGYYRRAKNLYATACRIVDEFHGEIPKDSDVLQTLPGIGPYTAGAIASTAYGVAAPAVDGNVLRVLGRVDNRVDPVESARYRRGVTQRVRQMLVHGEPGDINQALMDLGARVCTPRKPDCPSCPLAAGCHAHLEGDPETIPRRKTKTKPTERLVAILAWRGDRFLAEPMRGHGVLEGLWGPPIRKRAPGSADQLPEIVHTFSHKRWVVRPCLVSRQPTCPRGGRWVTWDEFAALPTSSLARRLVEVGADRRS